MIYTLVFKCHGKEYSLSRTVAEKAPAQQYDAIAEGLKLEIIEKESLSPADRLEDICLLECDENGDKVNNPVWAPTPQN